MLEIIAFCCGALVMVLEMVGARVLAPHVGTSAVVWTSLIGVVLACLAVGAWLGGRLADRHLSRRGLAFILTGASLGSALAAGTHRLVGGELGRIVGHGHHDLVEDGQAAADEGQMPVGQGVESAGIECQFHASVHISMRV